MATYIVLDVQLRFAHALLLDRKGTSTDHSTARRSAQAAVRSGARLWATVARWRGWVGGILLGLGARSLRGDVSLTLDVVEERVVQGRLGAHAVRGIELQQRLEQLECGLVACRIHGMEVLRTYAQ